MRILLTNDDGIHAEGLAVLERIAKTISDDVWVVAPETDQSGFAHSLSLSTSSVHPIFGLHMKKHGISNSKSSRKEMRLRRKFELSR